MAVKYGIDNTPDAESKDHIIESIENLLDPLQEAWSQLCASKGIERDNLMITSGYRCYELNKRMKESSTSAHTIGYAFDLLPANRLIMDFREFCKDYLSDKPFDQLISEQEIIAVYHHGYISGTRIIKEGSTGGCCRCAKNVIIFGKNDRKLCRIILSRKSACVIVWWLSTY